MGTLLQMMVASRSKVKVTGSFGPAGGSYILSLPVGVKQVSFTGRAGYGISTPNPGVAVSNAGDTPVSANGADWILRFVSQTIYSYAYGVWPSQQPSSPLDWYRYGNYQFTTHHQSYSTYGQPGVWVQYLYNADTQHPYAGFTYGVQYVIQSEYGATSTQGYDFSNILYVREAGAAVCTWLSGQGSGVIGTESTQIFNTDGSAKDLTIEIPNNGQSYLNYEYYV